MRTDVAVLRSDIAKLHTRLGQFGFGLVFALSVVMIALIVAVAT